PYCLICPGKDKIIHHFIFNCPKYQREHHIFMNATCCDALSIACILSSKIITPHLLRYINSTRHLKTTFSEL
ncbi:hypothetical protein BDR06DRAFT_892535, partial [Suillus hirtellus]